MFAICHNGKAQFVLFEIFYMEELFAHEMDGDKTHLLKEVTENTI